MQKETRSSRIQVIDRLATLLAALAGNGGVANLKVLSAETGLHPSTTFRILGSATENGLIERNEVGHYRFGKKLREWGCSLQSVVDLRDAAQPVMEWLCDQVQETVNLTLREGDEVVYVKRATPNRLIRVEQIVGSHAPLHVTAVGKMMLGAAGRKAVRDYAIRTGLPAYTHNTITSQSRLWIDASRSCRQGYALDNEEAEIGVGCIGVLVHNNLGAVLAGLSISAPIERRLEKEWIPLLQEAVRRITERLSQPSSNFERPPS